MYVLFLGEQSLGFGLLVAQKMRSEDVTLGSENL